MFLTIFLFIIFLILFVCYLWFKQNLNYWSKYKEIPSIPGQLLSGNLKDIATFKTNFALQLKKIHADPKFQDAAVVGVYGIKPVLLVRHPELIKSVLIRDFESFPNRATTCDPIHDPCGSRIMIFAKDQYWKDCRAKLSPVFSGAKLKQMYPLFQQVGDNLQNFLDKKGDRFVCDFKELSILYATDIIATTVFGVNTDSLQNPLGQVTRNIQKLAVFNLKRGLNFLVICFMPHLAKYFKSKAFFQTSVDFVKATSKDILNEREKSGISRNDIIDIFVKLKQEAKANGEDMEEFQKNITAHTAMFIAAGFETTSSTMSNLLLALAKHPEIQKRLRQEISLAFLEGNGSISYETLHSLEYLNMCIDETLRMHPVFPVLERQYKKPKTKDGNYSLKPFYDYEMPDGMAVYISTFGLHYDPKYWTNPLTFDPERFSADNKNSIYPMTYLPYGDGPRYCIGSRLAQLELKAYTVQIFKNHYVQVCAETNVNPAINTAAFVLQTVGGVHLEVVKDNLYSRNANTTK